MLHPIPNYTFAKGAAALRRLRPRATSPTEESPSNFHLHNNCRKFNFHLQQQQLQKVRMKTALVLLSGIALAASEPQFGFLGVSKILMTF